MATQRRDGRGSGPELTEDPFVVITARGADWIDYECSTHEGVERWRIVGTCNQCGACESATVDRPLRWVDMIGYPGACIDDSFATRRDIPVRPHIADQYPSCSLRGEYR